MHDRILFHSVDLIVLVVEQVVIIMKEFIAESEGWIEAGFINWFLEIGWVVEQAEFE